MDINTLFKIARDGDQQAEERLFAELTDSFSLYVVHLIENEQDAEEVVQDVLLIIARKYKEVREAEKFAAWAYKVFENVLYKYYRSKKTRRRKLVQMEDCEQFSPSYNPDPELKRHLLDCLEKVARVNNRYAKILAFHFQGYTGDEIGRQLGISINSVRISLSRARAKVKACLEEGDIPS